MEKGFVSEQKVSDSPFDRKTLCSVPRKSAPFLKDKFPIAIEPDFISVLIAE